MARLSSRWDCIGDLRIHSSESAGPANARSPVIVMVHGLSVSGRYMIPTAELLASHYRAYAPDLPGFGRSDKPSGVLDVPGLAESLAAWMKVVGVGPAVLLGNSFGCQIIAELAARRLVPVGAVVLVGPTVDPNHGGPLQQLGRWLLDIFREPPSLWPIASRDYFAAGFRRTLLTFRYMLRNRIETRLPLVDVPTLVVRGSRDPIAPREWAREATHLLPRGELLEIPGAAHAVNYDSPIQLATAVDDFILRTLSAYSDQMAM